MVPRFCRVTVAPFSPLSIASTAMSGRVVPYTQSAQNQSSSTPVLSRMMRKKSDGVGCLKAQVFR